MGGSSQAAAGRGARRQRGPRSARGRRLPGTIRRWAGGGEVSRAARMSANATAAAPPAVPRCVGLCESTARTIGMLFMCISVFALAAGVVSSLVESFTGFRMRVYRSRATVAKENSFAAGRDPFALLYCLQMMALVSLGGGTGSATTRSPAALDAFAGWFQFANLQIPALSLFKHYGLRHTCDDRALDQFLGTVRAPELCSRSSHVCIRVG